MIELNTENDVKFEIRFAVHWKVMKNDSEDVSKDVKINVKNNVKNMVGKNMVGGTDVLGNAVNMITQDLRDQIKPK